MVDADDRPRGAGGYDDRGGDPDDELSHRQRDRRIPAYRLGPFLHRRHASTFSISSICARSRVRSCRRKNSVGPPSAAAPRAGLSRRVHPTTCSLAAALPAFEAILAPALFREGLGLRLTAPPSDNFAEVCDDPAFTLFARFRPFRLLPYLLKQARIGPLDKFSKRGVFADARAPVWLEKARRAVGGPQVAERALAGGPWARYGPFQWDRNRSPAVKLPAFDPGPVNRAPAVNLPAFDPGPISRACAVKDLPAFDPGQVSRAPAVDLPRLDRQKFL